MPLVTCFTSGQPRRQLNYMITEGPSTEILYSTDLWSVQDLLTHALDAWESGQEDPSLVLLKNFSMKIRLFSEIVSADQY